MSDKLKSRKLWAFIGLALLVVVNYLFDLGMPPADVLYLVILGGSYILGQGYVDAKQQKVSVLPSEDLSNSVTNIIQAEIAKTGFGKNLPMEEILAMFKAIMKQELSSVNTFTISPVVAATAPIVDPIVPTVVADPATPADPLQQSA